jgi:hypothetical protein
MLALAASISFPAAPSYTATAAAAFVGAQHWNESGWYADAGFKQHYDGYLCLCECHDTVEGIFCSGGGVKPDGITPVASFLAVFSGRPDAAAPWEGHMSAYNTTTPFADSFSLVTPGGPSNYTGVSQSLGGASFVWRGYMSGVQCEWAPKCSRMCAGKHAFSEWARRCERA